MYSGDHSIIFTTNPGTRIDTWTTWGLIPESRPLFEMPKQKETIIDIPGANGSLNLSEALTGYPIYENRSGSWNFIVDPEYRNHSEYIPMQQYWAEMYSKLANFFNGHKMTARLRDDPDWYYEGTFKLSKWDSQNDGTWSMAAINYEVSPYKLSNTESSHVLTRPTSTIRTYDITNELDEMPVKVYFTNNSGGEVEFTYTDGRGVSQYVLIPNHSSGLYNHVILSKSSGTVEVSVRRTDGTTSTGNLVISWRNGRL